MIKLRSGKDIESEKLRIIQFATNCLLVLWPKLPLDSSILHLLKQAQRKPGLHLVLGFNATYSSLESQALRAALLALASFKSITVIALPKQRLRIFGACTDKAVRILLMGYEKEQDELNHALVLELNATAAMQKIPVWNQFIQFAGEGLVVYAQQHRGTENVTVWEDWSTEIGHNPLSPLIRKRLGDFLDMALLLAI
jgi:hypothetical protein